MTATKNTHGGARPGSGRRKGGLSKRVAESLAIIAEKGDGITPLEIMVEAMNKLRAEGDLVEAAKVAALAAPYVHARLSAIEHSGEIATAYVAQMPALSSNADEWSGQHAPRLLQ